MKQDLLINILIGVFVSYLSVVAALPWYVGCYYGYLTPTDGTAVSSSPAQCAATCYNAGFPYAEIHENQHCSCKGTITNNNSTHCIRCQNFPDLWCGGHQSLALYRSRGPYILNATIRILHEQPLYVYDKNILHIGVTFAALPNFTIGLPDSDLEDRVRTLNLTLFLDGQSKNIEEEANDIYFEENDEFTFSRSGSFIIGLHAANAVSSFSTTVNVTVQHQVPSKLHVTMGTTNSSQPSCRPENATLSEHVSTRLVFANETVRFVASVSTGYNVTFDWLYGDGLNMTDEPYLKGCDEIHCRSSETHHLYQYPGKYMLQVIGHNEHGSTNDTIQLIVVQRIITNFSLDLAQNEDSQSEHFLTTIKPFQSVSFLISVYTTVRQDTYLDMDPGDGSRQQTHLLVDKHGEYLGQRKGGPDHISLLANYGDSVCLLNLAWEHTYTREGFFLPHARVYNNNTDLEDELPAPIAVLSELQGLYIQGEPTVVVGEYYEYMAGFDNPLTALNTSFTWTVVSPDDKVVRNVSGQDKILSFNFRQQGNYKIKLKAENPISFETADFPVDVHGSIGNLSLVLDGASNIKLGDPVTLIATAESDKVRFEWDFHGRGKAIITESDNHTSAATFIFDQPGNYSVEVNASTNYESRLLEYHEKIQVLEPIETLYVTTNSPTLAGNLTTIKAEANGSNIKFELHYDNTTQLAYKYGTSHYQWRVNFTVGEKYVTVIAKNEVSQVKRTAVVEVVEPVHPSVSLTYEVAVQGEKVIFKSLLGVGNQLSNRSDLLYTWTVEQVNTYLTVPVFDYMFEKPEDEDSSNMRVRVAVEVSNRVCEIGQCPNQSQLFVIESQSQRLRFIQGAVWEFPFPVQFSIVNLPDDCEKVKIDFVKTGTYEYTFECNATSSLTPFNRTHNYSAPGVYDVEAVVSSIGKVKTETIRTIVTVQERIKELRLEGPKAVPVRELSPEYEWKVLATKGSHMLYEWYLDGELILRTPRPKLRWRFEEAKEYDLGVRVSNSLGGENISSLVIAEYAIHKIDLQVLPVFLHDQVLINFTVHGGPMRKAILVFGDGQIEECEDESEALEKEQIGGIATGQHGPTTRYYLRYRYKSVGSFTLVVNVSNHVSSVAMERKVMVEEPIEGLKVWTDSGPVVNRGSRVVVMASVRTGQNLVFDWHVSHNVPHDVESSNRSSSASFTLAHQGIYDVTVFVSNSRLDTPYETASLADSLVVQEKVGQLTLTTPNSREWARLYRDEHDQWRTNPVNFTARVNRGSDVTFYFNYGDGHNAMVEGVEVNDALKAQTSHVYHQEGYYTVQVTAKNLLGNITATYQLGVQIPPGGCALSGRDLIVKLGSNVTIYANYTSGSDVKFDWDMGNHNEYINIGSSVTHGYTSEGTYTLNMKCYNDVGSLSVNSTVVVVSPISGVEVVVLNGHYHKYKEPITFEAVVIPSTLMNEVSYLWNFGEYPPDLALWERGRRTITKEYIKARRYEVQVRAFNGVSNQTSPVVQVDVIEPIKFITLTLIGEPLVRRRLTLEVYHYGGTSVTYHWDLGDGHTKKTKTGRIEHSYDEKGEYNVTVTASNRFGNQSVIQTVFILHKLCNTPEVSLLIPADSQLKVTRSEDFKLESQVKINCSITSEANYTWTLRKAVNHEIVVPEGVPVDVFQDPILYLPRRSLSYGNYSLELKVAMQGTIVYSRKQTYFSLIPSQLLSIINGGIRRRVQRNETIVMDGSDSYDPDFPNATDIRYSWSCYQLDTKESCFRDEQSLNINYSSKMLYLNGSSFSGGDNTPYVFNLSISRPGRQSANTSQVLDIAMAGVIDMKLSCFECKDGSVNSDQRLILEAVHPGYKETELEYEWLLFTVDSSNTPSAAQAHDDLSCVAADGSSYHSWKDENTTMNRDGGGKSITADENGNGQPTSTTSTTAETVPGSTRMSTTTSPERSHPGPGPDLSLHEGTSENADSDHYSLIYPVEGGANEGRASPAGPEGSRTGELISIKEGPSSGGLDGTVQAGHSGGRGSRRGSDPASTAVDGSASTTLHTSEVRGNPRGSGSGSGRVSGQTPGDSATNQHQDKGTLGGGGNVATDMGVRKELPIFSKVVTRTWIKQEQTTTGLNQRALVIKKDVLKQGRTYIIEGRIKHKATDKQGTASAYVTINKSPGFGECSLKPQKGVEIETSFSILCSEWEDNDEPIQYEISYSLDNGKSRDLIYQGLNHQTIFKLPAGNPKLNNTVQVNIAIMDKYGARTTVCSIPVTVSPKTFEDLNAEGEDLLELVKQENITLQTYMSKGDNRNARLHTQLVAHRLNRLHKKGNDSDNSIRAQIRTTLLHTLKNLPMRDEYEVQQTTSAVAASTAITDELSEESLEYASEILVKASERVTQISDITKHVDRDIISVAIVGSSNIVAAVSDPRVDHERTKPVVERARWSIHNLTQTELNFTVPGEEPLKRETEHLSTYAGRFKMSHLPNIETSAANFTLPNNLNAVLEKQITTKQGGYHSNETRDCYEMHVVTYKQNPFLYGKGRLQQVQSQVASLALFACGGPQLAIQDLPPSDQVVMTIPHLPEKVNNELPTYVLHKHQMKVHQINVSLDPTDDRSVYILLELEPLSQGRLFPIALLLRPNEVPTPTQYQFKKVFPADAQRLSFSLPPHSLNESITYYLGVVDVNFNADRPRPGEVRERRYSLRIWKGECVFWDEENDAWSSKGCKTSLSSTYTTTNCKCNHLTAFGTQLSLIPNDLRFDMNTDEFFDLNENPVIVSLVMCVFALYFILLAFCVMADKHDEKKGAIVHLLDNSTHHKHAYVITLETGMRRSAGTTAKVSFVLHGEEGMSETRELISELGQPLFERNSRDTFIMTLPEPLGHIWKVQIWHNNAGPSPDWYLSRVIVNDIQKSKTFYFSCEKWFAVQEEDGKVEREIMSVEYGLGFAKVLWAKGTQYLTDYHLWFSMLSRPSYSRFTRAQRLTCCLALIFSYMAVNAAWYRQSDPEYRGEVGLIDLSWRAVAVGAITSLLVLPVNLLLVIIFRRSKIKKVCIEEPPEKYYTGKRDSIASLDSTVRLLQPAATPSIFDQSMINWASLQDWAQRQWTKRYQQEDREEGQDMNKHTPQPMTFRGKHGVQECETDQTSSGIEDCIVHERMIEAGEGNTLPLHQQPVLPSTILRLQSINSEQLSRNNSQRSSEDSEFRWQQELDRCVLDAIRSRKSERCFLPYWFRYVAWVLAAIIIIGCSVITVLYGFTFGKAKSIAWLQSLFFSFLQCVFITHPVVVLAISVYTAIKYRNDLSIFDHHDDGIIEQRTQAMIKARLPKPENDKDVDLAKGIAERQRSRYLRCARPPQEKQLIEARKKIMKEKKAKSLLSDSLSAAILIFLLIFVAYTKSNTTPYRLNSVLKDILTKSGSQPFVSIQRIDEWYKWSQTDLLDALYWETWYNGQPTGNEKGYVGNSAIIGSVSLRQLRVLPERCRTSDLYHITTVCRPHYQYGNHDVQPYGINGTWKFYESPLTRATGFSGRHAHYDGSGYRLILPSTRKEAYKSMKSLEAGKWIDLNTRGIVIEFTLFNAPTNIFTSVSLLMEVPPTGGPSTMCRIKSVYLFKYTTDFDNFVLACELLLMVVTLYKLHCEIGELAWLKKNYFKNPWNTIEAAVLILLLAYISCYIYRFVLVHEVVELMRSTYHEEFVDISYVAYWDEILRAFLGFIILLTLVKSLRLLRNRKVFSKIGGVYRKAGMEILCLGCIMAIWLGAYTCLGYALFGAVSHNFSRVGSALTTVVALLTGQVDMGEAALTDRIGSQIFLISFLIFAIGSLTAYIVAVLTFQYRVYRDEGLPSLTTVESFRYFWNNAVEITGLGKKPSEEDEEQENKLRSEFTMAEIENQVDEMLFKMNALTGSSGLPEKAPDYITSDSDCTYGTGDDGISSGGSEVRPLDEVRLGDRLNKIEDNLMGNDAYLAQLFKLDSIGASVLSEETENQLRSALEFETFRQLQMRRGNNPEVQSLPSDNGQVIVHRLSSLSSSSSTGSQGSSSYGTPVTMPTSVRKSREHLHKTRTEQDVLSLRSIKSKDSTHSARTPTRGSRQSLSMSDGIMLQNLTEGGSSGCEEGAIPLQDLVAACMAANPGENDSQNTPSTSVETRLLEDPVSTSSCSSGGAEIRSIVSHPRALTVHSIAEAMIKGGAKPKPRNLALLDKQLSHEHIIYGDTSSGSERDAALRSSTSKARNLRKTKSRGKGKGRSRLTLVDGIDELGLDNEGYTSESDHESRDGTLKSRHKHCWN